MIIYQSFYNTLTQPVKKIKKKIRIKMIRIIYYNPITSYQRKLANEELKEEFEELGVYYIGIKVSPR
jgi:hypothetical protein